MLSSDEEGHGVSADEETPFSFGGDLPWCPPNDGYTLQMPHGDLLISTSNANVVLDSPRLPEGVGWRQLLAGGVSWPVPSSDLSRDPSSIQEISRCSAGTPQPSSKGAGIPQSHRAGGSVLG